jgi:hypothetical protein
LWYKNEAAGMSSEENITKINESFPNYATNPKVAQSLRKYGVFGPFVSFQVSVARIMGGHAIRGFQDILSGNKVRVGRGIKTLLLLATVLSLSRAASEFSKILAGVDPEEEELLRASLDKYRRNGVFWYYRENGKLKCFDLQYYNPIAEFASRIERNITKAIKGDTEIQDVLESMNFLEHPVLDNIKILAQGINPQTDQPINPEGGLARDFAKRAEMFLIYTFLPSSMPIPSVRSLIEEGKLRSGSLTGSDFRRILDAYSGASDENFKDKLIGFVTGANIKDVDPAKIIAQRVRDITSKENDIKRVLRSDAFKAEKIKSIPQFMRGVERAKRRLAQLDEEKKSLAELAIKFNKPGFLDKKK